MNDLPEQPLSVSPSLASKYGVDGALLLGLIEQYRLIVKADELTLSLSALQERCPFWSEAQLLEHLYTLASESLFGLQVSDDQLLISFEKRASQSPATPTTKQAPAVSQATAARPQTHRLPNSRRNVPPSFGGGWRRSTNELDEIFEAAEQKRKLQIRMDVSWRPDESFYQLLQQHGIEARFAESHLDEFTLYYLDKLDHQSVWNQKFLAWVKRAVRDQESRSAKAERFNESSQAGGQHEKSRRDTRENRKRVTAAVMDLKNLDW
ncbi:MAG: DnaT-like ssDNA-binding domain-containing protein [Marinobacterium sp.]